MPRHEYDATYDLIVIGGGLAGICAAIQAARLGCATALVQDRPVLGGNSSSEIRVTVRGADHSFRHARETGIVEELLIEDRFRDHAPTINAEVNSNWDLVLWQGCGREPNLTPYLNASARRAIMRGKSRIEGIEVAQLGNERALRLMADLFVDASGDGAIAASAGAEFRMGREARAEFCESRAPEQADAKTLGSSLMFQARDVGHPVKFDPPDWAADFPGDEDLPFRNHSRIASGYWWIEWGGDLNTIDDNDQIRDTLWAFLYGVWDHIKNRGDHGADNYALEWVGAVPGKRESRRFMGDHLLTQNEIEARELFADRVAYGGWPIDLHPPDGIRAHEPPADMSPLPGIYSIPFRCLYSRNVRNLMLAGRNISVTHAALGSTRVMATGAVEGQAVGAAAYLCKEHRLTPRQVGKRRMRALQQLLLKHDAYVIGVKNADADDLARGARASASSVARLEIVEPQRWVPLEAPAAQLFVVSEPRLSRVGLWMESARDEPVMLTARLYAAQALDDLRMTDAIAECAVEIPQRWQGRVDFPLDRRVNPGRAYWLALPAAAGLAVGWAPDTPIGGNLAGWDEASGCWRQRRNGNLCFALEPESRPYTARQVLTGVARPEKSVNIWISDPQQSLPQELRLEFDGPQTFDTIHLTFDTNLHDLVKVGPAPECAREYSVLVCRQGQCATVERVLDNHHRRRVHRFAPVVADAVRLAIEKTWGAPSARLYEVRVYRDGSPP
jgi:hypothetical protein